MEDSPAANTPLEQGVDPGPTGFTILLDWGDSAAIYERRLSATEAAERIENLLSVGVRRAITLVPDNDADGLVRRREHDKWWSLAMVVALIVLTATLCAMVWL